MAMNRTPASSTRPPPPQAARDGITRSTRGPRLPHEHDESSDSQRKGATPGEKERRAHDDVARGVVDTDRGPVLEKLYREKVKR